MVGYRNESTTFFADRHEFIRHSDGGVSEHAYVPEYSDVRVYQAFRWWGIGTVALEGFCHFLSLSGIPMVGYRNYEGFKDNMEVEFIRHSDGGVSERANHQHFRVAGVYQAFRWWGIGTGVVNSIRVDESLSGIPMVGYRNQTLLVSMDEEPLPQILKPSLELHSILLRNIESAFFRT